jgi:hypothetical protein
VRYLVALALGCVLLLNSGCAIFDAELHNRGGYLDVLADNYWFKADSKKMRALRAFALQTSLARIASVSPKNDKDRQLMAIRIGDASVRAGFLYNCAFGPNPLSVSPLNVALAKNDECFYFDSLMVDYTTSLFDLAMISFPVEDTQNLVNLVVGGFTGPTGALDALNALLNLAKEALKYGRIIGALYRDTVELEVQVWLNSPREDQTGIPDAYRITDPTVAALKAVYDRKNDDMNAWVAEIAKLRAAGLEPFPSRKHFYELGALIQYLCGLIVSPTGPDTSSPYNVCVHGLILEPVSNAVSAGAPATPAATPGNQKTSALRRNSLAYRLPFMDPSIVAGAVPGAKGGGAKTSGPQKRASLEASAQ